jgi:hypothetical protein
MKKIVFITVLSVLFMVALSSCKKEESVISGQITYIGSLTGIEYYAEGAEVYLYYGSTELDDEPTKVIADENGNYSFPNLWDGNWQIYATITVNGFTYSGTSSIIYTTGEDIQTVNLVLNN